MRLRFLNQTPNDATCIHNVCRLEGHIQILFLACVYGSPAAWTKDQSFETCFRSIASFGDLHYLPRTSPHSIQIAWNSRIWHFYLNSTLLPRRNVWNLILATSRPESMKLTCQFLRIFSEDVYAGSRTDFWDQKSNDFSGEIFRERNFGRSITAPTTLFPVIGCGVDSYIPELEHL